MDGAGALQSFRRISLPLIRPALAIATVEALVLSLNIFDQVYILNGIAPLGSSVMLQTYVTTFERPQLRRRLRAVAARDRGHRGAVAWRALALLYRRVEAV